MATVFISHRRSDTEAAERLADALRAAGHQVWFDEWEIRLGDSIVGKMNEGLTQSAYLVLCFSDAGVEAPWISREWLSALAQQLNGAGVRILPVRLGGHAPAILANIKAGDLTRDWDAGLAELLRAIR
jgi:hypothetical protein